MWISWKKLGAWLVVFVAAGMLAHPWLDVTETARLRWNPARNASLTRLLSQLREQRLSVLAAGGKESLPSIAEIETILDPVICQATSSAPGDKPGPALPAKAPRGKTDDCDVCLTVAGPHLSLPGLVWTLIGPPLSTSQRLPHLYSSGRRLSEPHPYFQVRGPPLRTA